MARATNLRARVVRLGGNAAALVFAAAVVDYALRRSFPFWGLASLIAAVMFFSIEAIVNPSRDLRPRERRVLATLGATVMAVLVTAVLLAVLSKWTG